MLFWHKVATTYLRFRNTFTFNQLRVEQRLLYSSAAVLSLRFIRLRSDVHA